MEYVFAPHSYGAYDLTDDVDAIDRVFMTTPTWPAGHLTGGMFAHMAAAEPDRYKPLAEKGFQVVDVAHPRANLFHNLLERLGGHYADVGGTKVIAEGGDRVRVKGGVEITEWTERGLKFADGSEEEAEAVIWCTGFADTNGKQMAKEVLGGGSSSSSSAESRHGKEQEPEVLGPDEIASRLDDTFGFDIEGEIRGMWKRQAGMDNYWYMGGNTQHHRYHSKTVAMQIKAELEGILPPAYRDAPSL